MLIAAHPSLNLNAGVLYQYNQAAADELKKDQERVSAERAQKPVEDFVSVLDERARRAAPDSRLSPRRPSPAASGGRSRAT